MNLQLRSLSNFFAPTTIIISALDLRQFCRFDKSFYASFVEVTLLLILSGAPIIYSFLSYLVHVSKWPSVKAKLFDVMSEKKLYAQLLDK